MGWGKTVSEFERPIEKPAFPLPAIFFPRKRSELPTQRRTTERARFYRQGTTQSGSPVYGFNIEVNDRGQKNPGSKRQQDVG